MRKLPILASGWQHARLGDLVLPERPVTYGVVQPGDHDPAGVPLVRGTDFSAGWRPLSEMRRVSPEIDRQYSRGRLEPGDLVITIKGAEVGAVEVVPDWLRGANLSQTNARLALNPLIAHPRYVLHFLRSDWGKFEVYKHTKVGAQPGLIFEDIESFHIPMPQSLLEQVAIAQVLDLWDVAIEKIDRLTAAKERQRSAVSATVFESALADSDNCTHAKELLQPIVERGRIDLPLLAVMQDVGVVRRDQLDRRVVMPDGGIDAYKAARGGDFIISLRSFEGGLEFSEIEGLVSPAYTVLRPIINVVPEFYRWFFKSRSFIGRIDKLVYGIRDGKQIAFRDFGDMRIPHPALSVQRRYADLFGCLADELAATTRLREALARQKRGLMQKLLTGEWPLTVPESQEAAE